MKEERKYFQTFVVRGRWNFPIDMLRYDQCWPIGDGLELIGHSIRGVRPDNSSDGHSVKLGRWVDHPSRRPTLGRWASFGWYVIEDTIMTDVDGEWITDRMIAERAGFALS